MKIFLCLHFSFLVLRFLRVSCNPVVTSIGGITRKNSHTGGQLLKIYGSGFQSAGPLTAQTVFLRTGRNVIECPLVKNCIQQQCGTNTKIVCTIPPTGLSGNIDLNVEVYVQVTSNSGYVLAGGTKTVINFDSSMAMTITSVGSQYTWPTSLNVVGYRNIQYPVKCTDLQLTVDKYITDLGLINNKLNNDSNCIEMLYYTPPGNVKAGFRYLILNNRIEGPTTVTALNGLATWSLPSFQTFQGTSHHVAIFPVIKSVFPQLGSTAGGQKLTISGLAFSNVIDDMTVYVDGVPCKVSFVTNDRLECITAAKSTSVRRSFGSAGWLVKVWRFNDNVGAHKYARLKMLQRSDFGFHLPSQFGLKTFVYTPPYGNTTRYTWDTMLGFTNSSTTSSSINNDGPQFIADGGGVFCAPVDGSYVFTLKAGDYGSLYMSYDNIYVNEILIATSMKNRVMSSVAVTLRQDDRLFLRFRMIHNETSAYIAVGLSLTPSASARRLLQSQLVSTFEAEEERETRHFESRLRKARKLKQALPHIFRSSLHSLVSRQPYRSPQSIHSNYPDTYSNSTHSNSMHTSIESDGRRDGRRRLTQVHLQATRTFSKIPMWMMEQSLAFVSGRIRQTSPSVEVYVKTDSGDKMKAICDSSEPLGFPDPDNLGFVNRPLQFFYSQIKGNESACVFAYDEKLTPTITDYNILREDEIDDLFVAYIEIQGSQFLLGATTIEGTYFHNVLVTIAGEKCSILYAYDNSIICTASTVPSGKHRIVVNVEGIGNALNLVNKTLFFDQKIKWISLLSGSFAGGQGTHIRGYGFPKNSVVYIGNYSCRINNSSDSQNIYFETPKHVPVDGVNGGNRLPIVVNGMSQWTNDDGQMTDMIYNYEMSMTPIISSVHPINISTAITTKVTIHGHGYIGVNHESKYESETWCTIGGSTCEIINVSDTEVTCYLKRNVEPKVQTVVRANVILHINGKGNAGLDTNVTQNPVVLKGFQVDSIRPFKGSYYGGTRLLIHGFGFLAGSPAMHFVDFTTTAASAEYIALTHYLGVTDSAASAYTLNCNVTTAYFHNLTCDLSYFPFETYSNPKDQNLFLNLDLNSINPFVRRSVTYAVAATNTPTIHSIQNIITSTEGITSFTLKGAKLLVNATTPIVTVGDVTCNIPKHDNTTIKTACLGLSAGNYKVFVLVPAFGYAKVAVQLTIPLVLQSVALPGNGGLSLGGGTKFEISGGGFSQHCSQNFVTIVVSDKSLLLPVSNLKYCSFQTIIGNLPSLSDIYDDIRFLNSSQGITKMSVRIEGVADIETKNFVMLNNKASRRTFQYTLSATPVLEQYFPRYGHSSTITTIHLSINCAFVTIPSNMSEIVVHAGRYPLACKRSVFDNMIDMECNISFLPTQSYELSVSVGSSGRAVLNATLVIPTFLSQFTIDPMSQVVYSSIRGGKTLHLSGTGLSSPNLQVFVCDSICNTTYSDYNNLNCTLPGRITGKSLRWPDINATSAYADRKLEMNYPVSVLVLKPVDDDGNSVSKLFDNNLGGQFIFGSGPACSVGIEAAPGYAIKPSKMRFYPVYWVCNINYYPNCYVGTRALEGLTLNGIWVKLETDTVTYANRIINNRHVKWIELKAKNDGRLFKALRYTSYASPDGYWPYERWWDLGSIQKQGCKLAELQFFGSTYALDDTCEVSVADISANSSPMGTQLHVANVSYALQTATPYVSSITPNNGSSLGGTVVKIKGRNFINPLTEGKTGSPIVYIDGAECIVSFYTNQVISCATGSHVGMPFDENLVEVLVPGLGSSVMKDDCTFAYMDKWSYPTTWMYDELPIDGDIVWVPKGQSLLIDVDTPRLLFLLVEGVVYVDSTKPSLSIDSRYILIHGGKFIAGTTDKPYNNYLTITIRGDRYTDIEMPLLGSKFITSISTYVPNSLDFVGVQIPPDGLATLELHGRKRLRSWTKLAQTAYAGSTTFLTSEPVDFLPGEILVLPGSGGGIEEVVVRSNLNGYNISITKPLKYTHLSEIRTIEGRVVDMRCEVALLSRNLIIQGDEVTESEEFGVITAAFLGGVYRIEDVEVRGCGQAFNLGRYCLHAHMGGNMAGNYVRSSVVHHSFNRAINLHAVSNFEVRDNVVFNIMGNAIFLEAGEEFDNVLSGNLGILARPSSTLLVSDAFPALFWTSTPSNYWYDNVAVNSANHGVWFQLSMRDNPDMTSARLGTFHNWTIRESGYSGIFFYEGFSPVLPTQLTYITSYRNSGPGFDAFNLVNVQVVDSIFIENAESDFQVISSGVNPGFPVLKNSIVVGTLNKLSTLANTTNATHRALPHVGVYFARMGMAIEGVTFINYDFVQSACFTHCFKCDSCYPYDGGSTSFLKGLKFVNSTLKIRYNRKVKCDIFYDVDGSLTNEIGGYLTYYFRHNSWSSDCYPANKQQFDKSMICRNTTTMRSFTFTSFKPAILQISPIIIKSLDNPTRAITLTKGPTIPIVNHGKYDIEWPLRSATSFSFDYGPLRFTGNHSEAIQVDFTAKDYTPYDFSVNSIRCSHNKSVDVYASKGGSSFCRSDNTSYYSGLNVISLIASSRRRYSVASSIVQSQLCPVQGCGVLPTVLYNKKTMPISPKLWSDKYTWIGHNPNATVPFNSRRNVTIKTTEWIELDIDTAPLGCIIIYGKMTFRSKPGVNITLNAKCIVVFGVLEIAGSTEGAPYEGYAAINIYGDKRTAINPPNLREGLYLEKKTIGVAGKFTAVGMSVGPSWVKLNSTVRAGMSEFYLVTEQSLDGWKVGSEVVLSTTNYYDDRGTTWDNSLRPANEIRKIRSIETVSMGYRTLRPTRSPLLPPSGQPTSTPSCPSAQPSSEPSRQPSKQPSRQPSRQPVRNPSRQPSRCPSSQPSRKPSSSPSAPSSQPTMQQATVSSGPSTSQPSAHSTMHPTSQPTSAPKYLPTSFPSGQPSMRPSTCKPSSQPTTSPSAPPSSHPSIFPYDYYVTRIVLDRALLQTHDCFEAVGEEFCGYIGLLTRNIVLYSSDDVIEDTLALHKPTYYGYGGVVSVFDLPNKLDDSKTLVGSIHLDNIEIRKFGQARSEQGPIAFYYSLDYYASWKDKISNEITNCAFVDSYNTAITASYPVFNLKVINNVLLNNTGGAILIVGAKTESYPGGAHHIEVVRNLAMASFDLPINIQYCINITIPGTTQISCHGKLGGSAAFKFSSADNVRYVGNVASGAYDSGFLVTANVFAVTDSSSRLCETPYYDPYSRSIDSFPKQIMYDNEAIGCQKGLFVATQFGRCNVIRSFKAWRNAGFGINMNDGGPFVIVADVVLADNPIGIQWSHALFGRNLVATGVLTLSKVIGSLSPQMCFNAVSGATPYSSNRIKKLSSPHTEVLLGGSKRIGIILPTQTHVAKGGFEPAFYGDMIPIPCSFGYVHGESVFGFPSSSDQLIAHVTNTLFTGFSSDYGNCRSGYGVAMAANPSQINEQSPFIMKNIKWHDEDKGRMDKGARMSSESNVPFIVYDEKDALLAGTAYENLGPSQIVAGAYHKKIVSKNPNVCFPLNFMSAHICPGIISNTTGILNEENGTEAKYGFKQYPAMWYDSAKTVTGPLIITRYSQLPISQRKTFFTVNTLKNCDTCAEGPCFNPVNQYPFYIVAGAYVTVEVKGNFPSEFSLRWDAPSESDSAVVNFIVSKNNIYNVFVGKQGGSLSYVLNNDEHKPTIYDRAGTNAANSFKRNVTVTLRGGKNNYLQLRAVPCVQIAIGLTMSITNFYGPALIANIATLLKVDKKRIKIVQVHHTTQKKKSILQLSRAREGFSQENDARALQNTEEIDVLNVEFQIIPNETVAIDITDSTSQYLDLSTVTKAFTATLRSGKFEKVFNTTIVGLNITPPAIPAPFLNEVVPKTVVSTDDNPSYEVDNAFNFPLTLSEPTASPTPMPSCSPNEFRFGSTQCQPCPPHSTSQGGSTCICDPGYFPVGFASSLSCTATRPPSLSPTVKPSPAPSKPTPSPTSASTVPPSALTVSAPPSTVPTPTPTALMISFNATFLVSGITSVTTSNPLFVSYLKEAIAGSIVGLNPGDVAVSLDPIYSSRVPSTLETLELRRVDTNLLAVQQGVMVKLKIHVSVLRLGYTDTSTAYSTMMSQLKEAVTLGQLQASLRAHYDTIPDLINARISALTTESPPTPTLEPSRVPTLLSPGQVKDSKSHLLAPGSALFIFLIIFAALILVAISYYLRKIKVDNQKVRDGQVTGMADNTGKGIGTEKEEVKSNADGRLSQAEEIKQPLNVWDST